MGCFLSSTIKPPQNPPPKQCITTRSPPPTLPFLEEETVKEVLSETPTTITKPIIHTRQENIKKCSPMHEACVGLQEKECDVRKHHLHDDTVFKIAKIFNPKEEPMGSGRVKDRSPVKQRTNSPAKRLGQLSGPVQTRNTSPGRIRPDPSPGRARPAVGRSLSRNEIIKKDNNGESSFRRTRSPVMCGDNRMTKNSISRCPSARKTGRSPGRVRSELGDRRRKVETGNVSYRENREQLNKRPPLTGNESLENPVVSFECFIFL